MVYNDYLEAYRLNQFDINDVAFVAKLVIDTYTFDSSHKPDDVKNYIIVSAGCLNGNVMVTKSMHEIMGIMKEKIVEEMQTNPNDVYELIDQVYANDFEKAQRIKLYISFAGNPNISLTEFWENLKKEGVKYFVVQYPPKDILCFHEEII